jgi:hypothetical protein
MYKENSTSLMVVDKREDFDMVAVGYTEDNHHNHLLVSEF